MLSLIPKCILSNVREITPKLLHELGVSVLFLDFDNTLLPYTDNTPTSELLAWLEELKLSDVTLCILSNTKRGRAPEFGKTHGVPCITHARKPFPRGVRSALAQFPPKGGTTAAIVGDQIYTDVLCANSAGLVSILVTPLHLHNFWLKLRHVLEKPWIAIGKRRLRHAKA